MSKLSISLVFTLLLVTAPQTAAQEPELQCYPLATQIGTAARQNFRDDQGFIVKEIYYTSTEGMRPSCAEGTLRVQSIRTYKRDSLGRALVETETGPVGNVLRMWRLDYDGDNDRPSRRTQSGPDGKRRYEIRYGQGNEQSHIYFDDREGVIGISGHVPQDIDLTIRWGPGADGWHCWIAIAPPRDGERFPEINLHLRNASESARIAEFVPSFETELTNDMGNVVPLSADHATTRGGSAASSITRVYVRPGEARFVGFDLQTRYGVLPPGRYTLQVRHPHPGSRLVLVSNTIIFDVAARRR